MNPAETQVERLQLLKTSKMKELVLRKRMELEEVSRLLGTCSCGFVY